MCLFIIRKISQQKILSSQRKNWLGFQKNVFLFIFDEKHFPEVVKNLEILYYLLIITNLVLKLLIAIYFVLIFFQFHSLEFDLF
jgi:ABC-type polysaccharide transport system permease subunit